MIQSFLKTGPTENLRIGLFGGSFNPPHAGHFALAEMALAALKLDYVWWLVSPQNPLKPKDETADFSLRMRQTKVLADHPRFIVSDIEAELETTTTFETLCALSPGLDKSNFAWLMGADSFAGLHLWNNWQEIPQALPLAVFDRPGWGRKALGSTAANVLADYMLPLGNASLLPGSVVPAWTFVPMPQRAESSTRIRSKNQTSVSALR